MFSRLADVVLVTVALVSLALVGCDDRPPVVSFDSGGPGTDSMVPPATAHARFTWRMRCDSGVCPSDPPPARSIDADNGQDGHEVECDLSFIDASTRRFDLVARSPDGYGIEVRGARIGAEGGRLMGSGCEVLIDEPDDVTVYDQCSASPPSAAAPCQIQRVDIREAQGMVTVFAELRCDAATAQSDPNRLRDITDPDAASGHALFHFFGCDGL